MKKLLGILCLNLVIGNVIAWFMGAAPIEFPVEPYTQEQQLQIDGLKMEMEEFGEEASLLAELGSLYSLHNHLDQADAVLTKALSLDSTDAVALASFHSNRSKLAGAMFDPLMGLRKVYIIIDAAEGLNDAVELAPDDVTVRLTRLATMAPIGRISMNFDTVFDDEKWFKALIEAHQDTVPAGIKYEFYLAMAQAYFTDGNQVKASQYYQQYLVLAGQPHTQAAKVLQQQITEVEGS